MRRLIRTLAAVAPIALAISPIGQGGSEAQQGVRVEKFFSGPVLFGPPRVAGPFRGRRPREFPTAETVGTTVNVTGHDAPQNETAIAVGPTGTLAAGANDYRDGDAKIGASRSEDGAIWSSVVLKLPGGLSVGADPSVAFENSDPPVAHMGGIGFNRGGPSEVRDGTVLVWSAVDAGFTGNEDPAVVAQGSKNVFHDKTYIGTGQLDGVGGEDVFISWTTFFTQGPFTTGFPIQFSRSTDGGVSWSAPVQVSDDEVTQGSVPVKGPGGLYVVWYDFGNFTNASLNNRADDSIQLDTSTDGGLTWGTDVKVADVVEIQSPLPGWDFRTNSFPSIGVFRPSGKAQDHLYVVFASDPSGNDAADIFFTKSVDGGANWSAPVRLNEDSEVGAHQFFPWLAVDPNGTIHVVWYDTRSVDGGATNAEINLFYTFSTDDGASWAPNNVRVSPQGFVPNADDQFGGGFIGDYNGLAASNPTAHALWTGYRGQDQDIFYAPVSTAPNGAPTADAGGPYTGTEDVAIASFDASGSSDPDGDLLTYTWDFGDGTVVSTSSPTISHTYLWGGTFAVTLTVSDGNGGTATDPTSATVAEVNDLSVADANGPYSGIVGQEITFDGSGSSDFDNQDGTTANDQTLTYTWNFGDGTTASTTSPTIPHSYAAANDAYPVTLTVNDGLIDSVSAATTATVSEPTVGAAPVVGSCSPSNGNPGEQLVVAVTGIDFQDGASADFGERVMVQSINFAGSDLLNVKIKVHPRAASGLRDVTVTNPDGQSGTNAGCFTVN